MILGTSSNVGKSIMTTALCRILRNKNISVAPFKSQNMSSNSAILEDGTEIAAAQKIQAEAAKVQPSVLMNPVLLKPISDAKSQIILLGKPWDIQNAAGYYTKTEYLLEKAVNAYHELSAQYDHILIEGAGGAAELNLYEKDIANILLARHLRLPILLVADIERGGVFAQIYGTIALLPEDIKPLVKGIIINKFRGDVSLFTEGRQQLERLTGVPVLGVIPFVNHCIEEEDSLITEKQKSTLHGDIYDNLADHVETHIDMKQLMQIMECK